MNPLANPARIAATLPEFWSPRVLAGIDDVYLKVAKLHGELAWHSHAQGRAPQPRGPGGMPCAPPRVQDDPSHRGRGHRADPLYRRSAAALM